MTRQRGWQGWTSCSPAQLTAPRRMRSLEWPDSLGKHFHSSRRISFFLFSIVPLCCLPLLPPPSIHVLRPPLHSGRGSSWMLLSLFPRGGGRGRALQQLQGCWGPCSLQWVLLCLCWPVAVGRRGPQSCSWKPLASPKPVPSLGGVAGMAALSFSSSWSPAWDNKVCSAWQAGAPLYFAPKHMEVLEDGSLQSKYLSKNISCTSLCQDCREVPFASPL